MTTGVPWNADRLYAPLRVNLGGREITGLFRDHYLSDLVGFVYSRMDAVSAAEDLYRRIRIVAERVQTREPLTLPLILGRRKCLGIFSAATAANFCATFTDDFSRCGHSRA